MALIIFLAEKRTSSHFKNGADRVSMVVGWMWEDTRKASAEFRHDLTDVIIDRHTKNHSENSSTISISLTLEIFVKMSHFCFII